jgi:NTP pyrophosphatase (non-canonical NTP hydrolase)
MKYGIRFHGSVPLDFERLPAKRKYGRHRFEAIPFFEPVNHHSVRHRAAAAVAGGLTTLARVEDQRFDPAGPYEIGSDVWPGLAKLAEEAGELIQVLAKLVGVSGRDRYYDGSDLRERLIEECGDLTAAIAFFTETNGLGAAVDARAREKLALFRHWHDQG